MYNKVLRLSLVMVSAFWMSGCGIIDYFFLPPPEDTAQEIFEAANDNMAEKNYVGAVERYNKLRENYPFSPYTIDAELAMADALYLDAEYSAAVEAYKDFESLHPRHPAVPYVLYQIGAARHKGFVSIDRATNDLQEGYEYLNRLVQTYPGSEYEKPARDLMVILRKSIGEHELYIAEVFWNMKRYGPAWRRYSYVAENFQDIPPLAELAQGKSLTAYHKYRDEQAKEVREQAKGTWRKWFTWL